MDDGLWAAAPALAPEQEEDVSILLVMDDGLWDISRRGQETDSASVSILLVMDDGLWEWAIGPSDASRSTSQSFL